MNELQLRTTEMFGEVQTDIYENEYHEMFMTARQLAECLGYKSKTGIDMLINRNPYLKDNEFSGTHNLLVPQGNGYSVQTTRVFNEDGIYEVTFLANTDKAREFRCWVRRLLKSLRSGDLCLINGNVTFSPELFDTALSKHLGLINDRLVALETKRPSQPNYWLWKKHIANKAVDNLCTTLGIDGRTAYDLVYDSMTSRYGFDKSFAISQFCAKYDIESSNSNPATVSVIDAIADSPEYQKEFMSTVNELIKTNNECPQRVVPQMDKVHSAILPLIQKYNDKSANGARTYGKVYSMMNTSHGWKILLTKNNCRTKKQLLLQREDKYKDFCKCVDRLMNQEV